MPSPDAKLSVLMAQLRGLPAGDRRAILARLSPDERERASAELRVPPKAPLRVSPYSDDIEQRISAGDQSPMTEAGRTTLAAAVAALQEPREKPGGSLADAFSGLLRERAQQ